MATEKEYINGISLDAARAAAKRLKSNYNHAIQCMNCGSHTTITIPKGTLIAQVTEPCANCGCTAQQVAEFFRPSVKP